jgi:hypothetical protein
MIPFLYGARKAIVKPRHFCRPGPSSIHDVQDATLAESQPADEHRHQQGWRRIHGSASILSEVADEVMEVNISVV